ncbi:sulfate ABC transporter permease subunit CysT [candidate division KSB1 bacterium]|nr:sulfate ABC transporter permease subunit CysT [candidate division KSB1 bacterium]RQW06276.1 MAG: sulfate ABC transporter permease subunit CysT [candidate division KSB1 bacterium]
MLFRRTYQSVIPGFSFSMGLTLAYLGLIVIIPLSTLYLQATRLSFAQLLQIIFSARSMAAFALSFGASFIAASINCVFGFLVAWVLVRYTFPGKFIIDALVDLPFALPTAVAGIALTSLYTSNGWIGEWLARLGIQGAYSRTGVVIALTFIGLPFVVRTLQPVLADIDPQSEEASVSLGASRWKTFSKVLLPDLMPAALTGFALAFARALGEYGSVVFISGNMPMRTEIVPLLIMTRLEEYDYQGATALAAFMLILSFLLLLSINYLQWWGQRHEHVRV